MSIRPKRFRYSVENAINKRKSFITGGANAEVAHHNGLAAGRQRHERGQCCDRAGCTVTHSGTSCSTNCYIE